MGTFSRTGLDGSVNIRFSLAWSCLQLLEMLILVDFLPNRTQVHVRNCVTKHVLCRLAQVADVMSACFIPGEYLVTGALSGELLVWDVNARRGAFACCVKVYCWKNKACILKM